MYKWLKSFTTGSAKNLLIFSTLLVVVLASLRVGITHSLKNIYIIWNLFLASIPYFIVSFIRKKEIRVYSKSFWGLFFLWLIFLPNSSYIITDLVHLQYNKSLPIWYDISKLFLAGFTGLLWGHFSVFYLINYIEKEKKILYKNAILFTLFLLTSYGIYIGRYLRWNSWDIFVQPINVLISLKSNLCLETIAFVFTFSILQLITYLTLKFLIFTSHELILENP